MSSMFRHDAVLRADAPFIRYRSMSEAGIDINALTYDTESVRQRMAEYKEQMIRLMAPKFRVPMWVRAESGPLVNTDEALEGVAECYRRRLLNKKAPLKIGINVSRSHHSSELSALRGAAVMAFIQLCKMRGQNTYVELCYGNGQSVHARAHVRIGIETPTEEILTRISCSDKSISEYGTKVVQPFVRKNYRGHGWIGYYRFYEFAWEIKGNNEYDFALDRVDTNSVDREYRRILDQLKKFGVS